MTTPHPTSRLLSFDDGDLHVRLDGDRGAPALLLIHGSAASAGSWDPLVPLLTGAHHVIRVDLLGHGRSDKPDDADYAIPEQARRVGAVLDRLGVGRAIVVGHSTGGSVATALAECRPDLVAALVLINTGPSLDAYIAPETPIGPGQWSDLTDEQIRQAMSSAFGRPDYRPPQELVDAVRAMTYRSFTTTMGAARAHLARRSIPDRLAVLGTPLLVIFGDRDRRWRPSSAADYHAVPGATVELVPGSGHSPMMEDPERTAALLLAFAARQD